MKQKIYCILIAIFYAHPTFALQVPFEANYPLQPGQTIRVDYNFTDSTGFTHPTIYCYENTFQLVGSMQWTYNHQITTPASTADCTLNNPTPLSQCALSTNTTQYGGVPADPAGIIYIANNTNTTLDVNCQYGF